MAKTIEQLAVEAFVAAIDGIAGVTAYLDREAPIPQAALPAVNVVVTGSEPVEFQGHGVDAHHVNLVAAMYDEAGSGETVTQQLSTLRGDVRAAVQADYTLGGIAVDLNEIDCDVDAADLPGAPKAGGSAIAYQILIWTRPGDPYTAGP